MGRAEQALYRAGLRLLKQYNQCQIPFTGIHGTHFINWRLDPTASFRIWSREPGTTFETGAKCLQMAQLQLNLLKQSEEETREAMREWHNLCQELSGQQTEGFKEYGFDTSTCVDACQMGMRLVSRQITSMFDPFGLEDADQEVVSIESLVQDIRKTNFALTKEVLHLDQTSAESKDNMTLEQLAQAFYGRLKYKYEPFEWLYEGLHPIMASKVLNKRKGTPAALALILSALGKQFGIRLLPMPLHNNTESIDSSHGSLDQYVDNLPPETAMLLKSRTKGIPPDPSTWLLRQMQEDESEEDAVYLDCRNGNILNRNELREKFPAIGELSAQQWKQQCILTTWIGLVNLTIQAHKRRGESDLVAHWIYIALSLDPLASEWERALSPAEVQIH